MVTPTYDIIRPRRGKANDWIGKDPVLLDGEIGVEYPNEGISSGGPIRYKFGDGVSHWTELPYADPSVATSIIGGGPSSTNMISIKTGTTEEWNNLNPVLSAGELVYDSTHIGIKVGDGIHRFSELRYIGEGR